MSDKKDEDDDEHDGDKQQTGGHDTEQSFWRTQQHTQLHCNTTIYEYFQLA